MLEATFTFVSNGKNMVGRAIAFEPMDTLIKNIQSKLGDDSEQITILSIDQFNSSDSVYFDKLIDFRSNC